MTDLQQHKRTLERRIIASVALYAAFGGLGTVASLQGTTRESSMLGVLLLTLVIALVVLPRSTMPSRWPEARSGEAADHLDMMRDDLRAMYGRVTTIRVGYLLGALVVLGLLPLMNA